LSNLPPDQGRISKGSLVTDLAQAMGGLTGGQREIAKRLVPVTKAWVAQQMGISWRQVPSAVLAIQEHFARAGLGSA